MRTDDADGGLRKSLIYAIIFQMSAYPKQARTKRGRVNPASRDCGQPYRFLEEFPDAVNVFEVRPDHQDLRRRSHPRPLSAPQAPLFTMTSVMSSPGSAQAEKANVSS